MPLFVSVACDFYRTSRLVPFRLTNERKIIKKSIKPATTTVIDTPTLTKAYRPIYHTKDNTSSFRRPSPHELVGVHLSWLSPVIAVRDPHTSLFRWHSLPWGLQPEAGAHPDPSLVAYATLRLPTPLKVTRWGPAPENKSSGTSSRSSLMDEEGLDALEESTHDARGDAKFEDTQVLVTLQVRGLCFLRFDWLDDFCLASPIALMRVPRAPLSPRCPIDVIPLFRFEKIAIMGLYRS